MADSEARVLGNTKTAIDLLRHALASLEDTVTGEEIGRGDYTLVMRDVAASLSQAAFNVSQADRHAAVYDAAFKMLAKNRQEGGTE